MSLPEHSVILLHSHILEPSYARPWQLLGQSRVQGTGFVIEIEGRPFVLTNHHCVNGALHIMAKRYGAAKAFHLEEVFSIPECDLAILQPAADAGGAKAFWKGLTPLVAGPMPSKGDKLRAYGFPLGGSNVSVTKGVISRLQAHRVGRATLGLAFELDATINPGNSGGPALNDKGEVVGVIYASISGESIMPVGLVISTMLLDYFRRAAAAYITKGLEHRGICGVGITLQTLSNPALQEYLRADAGLVVTSVLPGSGLEKKIQPMDVITRVNGFAIHPDGNILLRELTNKDYDELIPFQAYYTTLLPGDEVTLDIMRDGRPKSVKIKASAHRHLIPPLPYLARPSYYIYAGFVFTPLTYMVMSEKYSADESICNLITLSERRLSAVGDEQIVIVSDVLPAEYTYGYDVVNHVVRAVNGVPVRNLRHLRELIRGARGKHITITYDGCDCRTIVPARVNTTKLLAGIVGEIPDFRD